MAENYSCVTWTTIYDDVITENGSVRTSRRALTYLSEQLPRPYSGTYQLISSRVVVAICGFGLLCNSLALVLLIHRQRRSAARRSAGRRTDSRAAKSDISCFIALSISDFCFCAVLIPQWFRNINKTLHAQNTFLLQYELYEGAIVNTFVLSSTWLTVSMTINRYLHLSHPMWALQHLTRHFLLAAIFVSVTFSVVFNLPRFWLREITTSVCVLPEETTVSYVSERRPDWEQAYRWSYLALGILVPLCTLAYCNARIVAAVCQSAAIDQQKTHSRRNIITRTLIFIVFFYICLVSPTELIKFWESALVTADSAGQDSFLVVSAVVNLLQAINFSANIIPYVVLDKKLRQHVVSALCRRRQSRQMSLVSQTTVGANGSVRADDKKGGAAGRTDDINTGAAGRDQSRHNARHHRELVSRDTKRNFSESSY